MTFLAVKQILFNVIEYVQYRVLIGRETSKIVKLYDQKVKENPEQAD